MKRTHEDCCHENDDQDFVIHVANIPGDGTKEEVEAIFEEYGPLEEVFLSGISAAKKTRFAFVTLGNPVKFSAALTALSAKPPMLRGYRLFVSKSKASPLKCSECGAVVKKAELDWHKALMHTLRSQSLKRQRPNEDETPQYTKSVIDSVSSHILEKLSFDSPELASKAKNIETLERVIREFWTGAKIVPFGSYAVGLSGPDDDIDFSLQVDLKDYNTGKAWAERGILCALKKRIIGTLPLASGFMRLALDARVPVMSYRPSPEIKYDEKVSEEINNLRKTKFDLCVNRTLGVLNSKLLKDYISCCPDVVRPFLGIIRVWSRSWGINNSKGGLLNSYAVTLMGISFLQSKNILPNLQHGVDVIDKKTKGPDGRKLIKGDVAKEGLTCYWLQPPAVVATQGKEGMNFMDLFVKFLAYYGWTFQFHSDAVSIREDGGVVQRDQLGWDAPSSENSVKSGICIVDPFETTFNVARHISFQKTEEISSTFRIAYSMFSSELTKENVDLNAIADLVFKKPLI